MGENKGEESLEETKRNETQPAEKRGDEDKPAAGQLEAVLKASNISRYKGMEGYVIHSSFRTFFEYVSSCQYHWRPLVAIKFIVRAIMKF